MTSCGADPLRYDLLWVNNICYRVHPKVSKDTHRRNRAQKVPKANEDAYDECEDYDDGAPCQTRGVDPEEVQELGTFQMSITVPERYLPRICGQQHNRRKEMEKLTRTEINIPAKGTLEDVVVTGSEKDDVELCIEKIQTLLISFRAKDDFTHIVSVPLCYGILKKGLEEFKHQVVELHSTGISDEMFLSERKLHLTVCCLCLLDQKEVAQATEILQSCSELVEEFLSEKPLNVCVKELDIMNDDPMKVNVLYAKVFEEGCEDAGRLQTLCDAILERFRQSGFMVDKRARNRLKLHMTLINTKYAAHPDAVDDPKHRIEKKGGKALDKNPRSFDATEILKNFGNAQFGRVQLDRIELNKASQTDPDTGYYPKLSDLKLPNRGGSSEDGRV